MTETITPPVSRVPLAERLERALPSAAETSPRPARALPSAAETSPRLGRSVLSAADISLRPAFDHSGERPVFVTSDGRPRRRAQLAAGVIGTLMSAWIAAVVVGGSGFSTLPALTATPLTNHAFPARFHATPAAARHSLHLHRDHVKLRADHDLARAVASQPRPAAS